MQPMLIRQCNTLILIGLFDLHVKDAVNVNRTIEDSYFNWFVWS